MPLPKEFDGLTPKQRDFVLAYVETKNGSEACRRAGYKGNAKTLGVVASENLDKPSVKLAIESLTAPVLEKKLVNAQAIVAEIADVGFAEWKEFVKVRMDKEGTTIDAQLPLADKLKALKMLGDHVGIWKQPEGQETPRFQFSTSNEEEARKLLSALLKR